MKGLLIIAKYFNLENTLIIGSIDHDIIYSVDIDEIIANGLTKEDAIKLCKLNWMVDSFDCFSCFV